MNRHYKHYIMQIGIEKNIIILYRFFFLHPEFLYNYAYL